MAAVDVAVVGQIGRDLVLQIDSLPAAGGSGPVRARRELLGGKGANQAVAFSQLGVRVGLLGVVGDDEVGEGLLAQAERDGIDVSWVTRRAGTASGLIVEILDGAGRYRYLEDLPESVLLTGQDVTAAAELVEQAPVVVIQAQQPADALLAAAELAGRAGAQVVVDGAPPAEIRAALLAHTDVLRADAKEAQILADARISTEKEAVRAGQKLLAGGPSLVALAVQNKGNAFVWRDGHVFLPLGDTQVVDTTGGGDSFIAALTTALYRGDTYEQAARWAVGASALTVSHIGGRPRLRPQELREQVTRLTPSRQITHSLTGTG